MHTTGTCLCKSITITVQITEECFDLCHCQICQTWGGGPAATIEAQPNFRIVGQDFISTYASSEWAERGFCKNCGTHLFFRMKDFSYYNFPKGLFKQSHSFRFRNEIFR